MADFPYVMVLSDRFKQIFKHVQISGKPSKVTQKTLIQWGLKSNGDRRFISLLKYVGFVDASGTPTDVWQAYRNKDESGRILGSAILSSYSDLFAAFPDADRKDLEALRNFFRANTTLGDRALQATALTFKALVDMADFDGEVDTNGVGTNGNFTTSEPIVAIPLSKQPVPPVNSGVPIVLNMNIQIALPETDNPDVYDNFFKSMKKYLLSE